MNKSKLSTLIGLFFYSLLQVKTALALTPAPPPSLEPSPPKIDPVPSAPSLSSSLSQTLLQLTWNGVEHAEYYPVYIYAKAHIYRN